MPRSMDDINMASSPCKPSDGFLDLRQPADPAHVLHKKLGIATPVASGLIAQDQPTPGIVRLPVTSSKIETRELPMPEVVGTVDNPVLKPGTTSKTFNDGPSVPTQYQQEQVLCTKLKAKVVPPACQYLEGLTIQSAGGRSLDELVKKRKKLRVRTGVLTDKDLNAGGGQYTEDKQYSVLKELGRGSYGQVTHCRDNTTNKEFVIKSVSMKAFVPNEAVIPHKLPHGNLSKVLGVIIKPDLDRAELLLEYAGRGLNSYVKTNQLSEIQGQKLMGGGLKGLAHLHKYGVTHYDIKPENLCVFPNFDGSLSLKVTDFGSCKSSQDHFTGDGMTVEYLAPEIAKLVIQSRFGIGFLAVNTDVAGKADVFAMGLVFMYLYLKIHVLVNWVTGGEYQHYEGCTAEKIMEYQSRILISVASEAFVHKLIPDNCLDPAVRGLIEKMVEIDPTGRISAADACTEIDGILDKQKESPICFPQISSTDLDDLYISKEFLSMMCAQEAVVEEPPIPDIAKAAMDVETGAMKHGTREKLRQKIQQPYDKGCKGQRRGSVCGQGHHRKVMGDTEGMDVEVYEENPGPSQVAQDSTGLLYQQQSTSTNNMPLPVAHPQSFAPRKNKTKRRVRPLKNEEEVVMEETETVAMEAGHHGNEGGILPNFDSLF